MAGLKTEKIVIDDQTYEITQLGAREGRRVLARLAHLAGRGKRLPVAIR